MKNVLLLDDDLSLCELMTEIISSFGGTSVKAIHSVDELKKNSVHDYHVTFLDVNLGQGRPTGLDAFKWLKEISYSGKIIFFTGHADTHNLVREALVNPQVHVLCKPADIATIEKYVIED